MKRLYKYILSAIILLALSLFWITNKSQFYDIARATGLMTCGFGILAGFYYVKNSNWNGYAKLEKLEVIFVMFIALSILLITVPETIQLLSTLGITMSTEGTGRILYILVGVYISKLVEGKESNLTNKSLTSKTCKVEGCAYNTEVLEEEIEEEEFITVDRFYTDKIVDNGSER